ncbi:MAG: hypothetical protein Q4F88_02640 [Eubacteriales bacterium]|nr:hypothetical protein [Eubacteriales bacterium]
MCSYFYSSIKDIDYVKRLYKQKQDEAKGIIPAKKENESLYERDHRLELEKKWGKKAIIKKEED